MLELKQCRYDDPAYELWKNGINDVLKAVFSEDSDEYQRFRKASGPIHLDYVTGGVRHETHQNDYLTDLDRKETAIKSILQKHEILGTSRKEVEAQVSFPNDLFDAMNFHPKIFTASGGLFKDRHYAEAIFGAFKAVNNEVKRRSNLDVNNEKTLMARAFDETNPILRVNGLRNQSDKNEQEGFKFIFMGATQGIRNPKAHDDVVQTDTHRTLEYLSLASLLMRRIDDAITGTPSSQKAP